MSTGIVRIGTVYIDKGTHQHDDNDGLHQQLVHSAKTIADLGTLAAAVQSKRAVLLEGETCSGKTALVQELARVCDKKLIVIALSHETDTAGLIGQWLPVTQHDKHSSSSTGISSVTSCQVVLGEIAKCLLTFVMPSCVQSDSADASSVAQQLQQLLPTMLHAARNTGTTDELSNVVTETCDVLSACVDMKAIPANICSECRSLQRLLLKTANATNSLAQHDTGKSALAFEFVEAELVRAIRNGDWVLLDNLSGKLMCACMCVCMCMSTYVLSGHEHGFTSSIHVIKLNEHFHLAIRLFE
jgi:midasin